MIRDITIGAGGRTSTNPDWSSVPGYVPDWRPFGDSPCEKNVPKASTSRLGACGENGSSHPLANQGPRDGRTL